ncbi:MAG: VIT1/CCC1 transporter family protein [Anaerolineales bacterium]
MKSEVNPQFVKGLQIALRKERATRRTYMALARSESNPARKKALIGLAETEAGHAERWTRRLQQLGAEVPRDHESLRERLWRWVLVQSGTDNALKRLEANESSDTEMYAALADEAFSDEDRRAITSVLHDEETHSRAFQRSSNANAAPIGPQAMLDIILHRESWHRRGGGWIGQAIYGANDGLGAVFGIVSGVAGATAGGPAVLVAGLAGLIASALSMGSGAYLASKTEREVQEAEMRREKRELRENPEEEEQELALFYQLKGVPEDEARVLASRLIAQPESALKTLGSEELGLSEQTFPNPWLEALSATISTALGAFIPIIPFFFTEGYRAIIASFVISTIAHFAIGASKTVVTGLSAWRSGLEMTVVGLGEALITYGLGLLFGPLV